MLWHQPFDTAILRLLLTRANRRFLDRFRSILEGFEVILTRFARFLM